MSTDRTLARINDTLDEWSGFSPDAARWAGGPEEGEWPEHRSIAYNPGRRLWLLTDVADPAAPTAAEIEAGQEITHLLTEPTLEQMFMHGEWFVSIDGQDVPLGRECWKCRRWHYGDGIRCDECWPKHVQRPHSAAERTRSPRWRSGTRRTKRHARRRP